MSHHTCESAFMFLCSLLRVNAIFLSEESECYWCWISAKVSPGHRKKKQQQQNKQNNRGDFRVIFDIFLVLLFIPQAASVRYSATTTDQCLQAVSAVTRSSAIRRVYKLLALALVSASRIIQMFLTGGIRFVFGRWRRRQMHCHLPSVSGSGGVARRVEVCPVGAGAASAARPGLGSGLRLCHAGSAARLTFGLVPPGSARHREFT